MRYPQSQIVKKVLSPAVGMWLRTQVDSVAQLQVNVEAGSRLLLAGKIPSVSLSAHKAVYQGLHLSQIQLVAEGISTNLPQIFRGKPLRLEAPVPVVGRVQLSSADLNASLESKDNLLARALTDLLCQLLTSDNNINPEVLTNRAPHWHEIALGADRFYSAGTLLDADGKLAPVVIRTGVRLASSHELQLYPLEIKIPPDLAVPNLQNFQVDLGSQVEIQELTLSPGQLVCRCVFIVMP